MLARSVILNVAGTAASLVIGFVSSLLVARWLGSTDRGLFGLLQSTAEITANVAGFGVPFAVVYLASRRGANQRAIFGASLLWAAGLGAVCIPLAWIFGQQLGDALARGDGGKLWILAAVIVPATFLYWSTHNQLHAALRFGALNALLVLSKLVALALVVALVGVVHLHVAGALVSVLGAAVAAIVGTTIVLRGPVPSFERAVAGRLLQYGVRVQAGTIFQIVNYRLDVFIVQIYRPLRDVGYYVIAQIVAELTTVLASAFQTTVMPLVARESDDELGTATASLRHHALLAGVATVVNVGFGSAVILLGYGPAYRSALVPMLILLPGVWFLGTGQVVAGILRGRNRPGLASAAAGVAVVLTISLDFALIPGYGVRGAAAASLCAYTVFGCISVLALSRVTGATVRTLVVPTRAELRAYPAALRRLMRRGESAPTAPR